MYKNLVNKGFSKMMLMMVPVFMAFSLFASDHYSTPAAEEHDQAAAGGRAGAVEELAQRRRLQGRGLRGRPATPAPVVGPATGLLEPADVEIGYQPSELDRLPALVALVGTVEFGFFGDADVGMAE